MIYDLVKNLWQIPAALVGIRHKIWKTRLESPRHATIAKMWVRNGWMTTDGNLTRDGLALIACRDFLEYQVSIFKDHCNDDLKTKAKTKLKNYDKLRSGLGQFFETELDHLFDQFGLTDKKWAVLDLGAGNGQYSLKFLKENPESVVIALDRHKPMGFVCPPGMAFNETDIEKDPDWYKSQGYLASSFDMILLSEVLHCKDRVGQDQILRACKYLLKPEGIVVVNENRPDAWFQWRMDLFANGKVLGEKEVAETMEDNGFCEKDSGLVSESHHLSIWKI